MELDNIGALIYLPHPKKIEQYSAQSIEYFDSLETYWMKKEGLIFYPFDHSKQAYFFGNTPSPKPIQSFDLTKNEPLSKEEYETSVFMAKNAMESSPLKKVVLARNKFIVRNHDPIEVFQNAVKKYTTNFGYYINIGPEQWVGASPELLIHYEDGILNTVALAGTRLINEKFTPKEQQEQQLVCDFIEDKLKALGIEHYQKSDLEEELFGEIKHLKTSYTLACSSNDALKLVKELPPTPAVCGLPRDRSFDFIQDFETIQRSFYAGVTGVLKKNSATFFVNLRCMRFHEKSIELFAGAGITKDSDPKEEWEETEKKIAVIQQLLS